MLNEKIKYWKFRLSCLKLKLHHKKLVNHNIKTLKFCLHNINKINFPTTDAAKETLTLLIDLYEKTVNDLNKDVERVKRYMHHEGISACQGTWSREFEREEKHE